MNDNLSDLLPVLEAERASPPDRLLSAGNRADLARDWCRYLWADAEGFAAMAIGRPQTTINPVTGEARYSQSPFKPCYFRWPQDVAQIGAEVAESSGDGLDVYMAPMLRKSRARKKDNGAGGRVAWVDLDGPMTLDRRSTLARIGDAALLVSSGRGHHAYVKLDRWEPPAVIESVNRALRNALDGDHKWSNESLLRPPGSLNHKPALLSGLPPALVQDVPR